MQSNSDAREVENGRRTVQISYGTAIFADQRDHISLFALAWKVNMDSLESTEVMKSTVQIPTGLMEG